LSSIGGLNSRTNFSDLETRPQRDSGLVSNKHYSTILLRPCIQEKKFDIELNALIELKPTSISSSTCRSIYPNDDLVSGFMDLEIQHFG
jgi:hypothetical protein